MYDHNIICHFGDESGVLHDSALGNSTRLTLTLTLSLLLLWLL